MPLPFKVQSVDRRASILYVDDINTHHEKWRGSPMTNLHGRAAHAFV